LNVGSSEARESERLDRAANATAAVAAGFGLNDCALNAELIASA
jgi:hypothetical protein